VQRWNLVVALLFALGAFFTALSATPGNAQAGLVREYEGTLHVISGDPHPASGGAALRTYWLHEPDGDARRLSIDAGALQANGNAATFDRQRVLVRGSAGDGGVIAVESIELAGQESDIGPVAMHAPAVGHQRWVNILCKFADAAGFEPQPREQFDELMGFSEPQLGHYWRSVSYAQLDISGSVSFGWYVLPQPRANYIERYEYDGGWSEYLDLGSILYDCTALADPHVNFSDFAGINMMFNGELDGFAWGGSWSLSLDSTERSFGVTWLPIWGYQNQAILAHEMGHGMGLMHSSGPYDSPYDSMWDLMSGGGTCNPPHPPYGCVGVHPIAYHKARLGWLPENKVFAAQGDGRTTIEIEPLAARSNGSPYLMAVVPIQGSPSLFYTVEVREQIGYDRRVPGNAVVIHRVDASAWERAAQVVDVDGNFDPNDDGARWLPGETFTDQNGGVSIRVERRTGGVYTLTISISSAFQRTWDRVDRPVAARATDRTWMWGPGPNHGPMLESYWDAPGAERTVIYYDKSRMEINNPDGDSSSIWYITNGLLVIELVTGRMQLSDAYHEQYSPASINVAGDLEDPSGPTYASFGSLLDTTVAPTDVIVQVVQRDGSVTTDNRFASYGVGVSGPVAETGHAVAQPFWEFMNASGMVWEDPNFIQGPLFINPYYATGYPITAPYWATVKVGGVSRDVLMQCFERRCLTWTPDNPPGWQVEAGNVGLHYYHWRYVLVPAEQDEAARLP
jgi:M6 family metalloprotease-like protein